MPAPYSLDLRERVLHDCDGGKSSEDAARKYSVAIATVYSWRRQRHETGNIAPKEHRGVPKLKLAPYEKEVRQAVADHPDATLVELAEMLSQYVPVSDSTVCDFLKHLKITWKKTLHAAEQHREDVVEQREAWKKLQEIIDIQKFIFIDETWTKTNMTPTHGRAEIGKRVIDFIPHCHWKTTTFLAALRHDGLTAPLVIDGAINGKIFLAWVK